jgi:nucleoside phosphorylase
MGVTFDSLRRTMWFWFVAGIGSQAARRAAEAVIALYAPKVVYSAGFAGALDPGLKVGDILQPLRVVNAGDGSSVNARRW